MCSPGDTAGEKIHKSYIKCIDNQQTLSYTKSCEVTARITFLCQEMLANIELMSDVGSRHEGF